MREIHDIHGGIHPPERKSLSRPGELRDAPLPARLVLPLRQHLGVPAKVIVDVGDTVLGGQVLAQAQGVMSVPVHAPTSGIISAIEPRPIAHASGLEDTCIILETDGADKSIPCEGIPEWQTAAPSLLVERIREAGIAGMGGAGFPTAVKLNPGATKPIDTLMINGTECEPYITADDTLMQCQADALVEGAAILAYVVGAERVVIGIEDNKPTAISRVTAAVQNASADIEVASFPTKYPSGGEKQFIEILTGQQVPSGGIPADIGLVCVNPGTAVAAKEAIVDGKPLTHRIVTLTGEALEKPGNVMACIGTPIGDLLGDAGTVCRGTSAHHPRRPNDGFCRIGSRRTDYQNHQLLVGTHCPRITAPRTGKTLYSMRALCLRPAPPHCYHSSCIGMRALKITNSCRSIDCLTASSAVPVLTSVQARFHWFSTIEQPKGKCAITSRKSVVLITLASDSKHGKRGLRQKPSRRRLSGQLERPPRKRKPRKTAWILFKRLSNERKLAK
jgi:RnfABCDGE-type electron transport complex C subunit